MKRTVLSLTVLAMAVMSFSLASFVGVFASTYKVEKTSNLGKASCMVCHASAKGGKLNPYGKDLETAMKAANSKKLTPAILKSVEGLDSDKDGVKNGDEIKKDSMPGSK